MKGKMLWEQPGGGKEGNNMGWRIKGEIRFPL